MPPVFYAMYNLKKKSKLYLVEGGIRYPIEIYPDISASQTFDEQSNPKKTLHRQEDLYAGASISKANPANFSFTSPLKLLNLGLNKPILIELVNDLSNGTLRVFDLYLENDYITYKITKCVLERATFNIDRNAILTVTFSGTGSKLSVHSALDRPNPVPGLLEQETGSYTYVSRTKATINGQVIKSLAALNIEIANEVIWTPNSTLHSSLLDKVAYPDSFVLSSRALTGSITEFLIDKYIFNIPDYSTSASISIEIYTDEVPRSILKFNIPSSVFTRRLSIDEIFTRVYDFRVNSNTYISALTYGEGDPTLDLNFTGLSSSLPVNPTLTLDFI